MDGLEDQVIEGPQRTDEAAASPGGEACASESQGPFAQALEPPAVEVRELPFVSEQLGALRRTLSQWAGEHGLGAEATEELVLAVNELATNSIRYGGGQGRLRSWQEGEALVCEIQDSGHIDDPLIGRSRPSPNEHTGRGLWLVHQLCDLVQIHSVASGTAVRVHKRRAQESAG